MLDPVSASKQAHGKLNNMQYWVGAFDENHPDTARHYEMLRHGLALVNALSPNTLLTIGDNLARDAAFFKRAFPGCHCIASDLCTSGIRKAVDDCFVDEVRDIDVEDIPYADDSLDIVIAKEAFHHWPRPMLGLYEMIRVAKKAVLIIEPNDIMYGQEVVLLNCAKGYSDQYEEVGNYKYQVSLREILKAAWSLYLPMCAATGFNDPYKTPFDLEQWRCEKNRLDALGRSGTREFNLLGIAIYKKPYKHFLDSYDMDIQVFTRPLNPFMGNDAIERCHE